jgi:hypothetical protein
MKLHNDNVDVGLNHNFTRKAKEITKNELSEKLKSYSDIVLLTELINRNGIGKAPSVTKRHGDWSEVLVAVGDDETAHITFPNEVIDNLRGTSDE